LVREARRAGRSSPRAPFARRMPPMRITVPRLFGGKARRKAPARPQSQDHTAPVYRGRPGLIGQPGAPGGSFRGTRPKASARAQLEARATARPPRTTGIRATPANDRPKPAATLAGRRNYPPMSDRLRVKPVVRAGTRFQLAERHERLASTRQSNTSTEKTRRQMQARPGSIQVHAYPAPYERRKAQAPTRVTAGTTIPVGGRRTTLAGEAVRAGSRRHELGANTPPMMAHKHPARGVAPRPPAHLPGDAPPAGRMGGARVGGDKPHPFFSKRG